LATRRRIILWDNLYANDYDINRAYMGCYQGRSLELCSRIASIMINPNCNLHINFMPMQSVCRFVECGVQQLAYSVAECRSLCASEWAPLFDGPMTPDNVILASDLLHLPYSMGERASQYVLLLSQICTPSFQLEPFREVHRDGMYRIWLLKGDSGAGGTHLYPNDWQAIGRRWVGPYLDLEPNFVM
jgi:hypothetical protein